MFSNQHQAVINELAADYELSTHEVIIKLATERLQELQSFQESWDRIAQKRPTTPTLPVSIMPNVNKTLPVASVGRVG